MPASPEAQSSNLFGDHVARDQAPLLSDTDHEVFQDSALTDEAAPPAKVTRPTLSLQTGQSGHIPRRASFIDEEEQAPVLEESTGKKEKPVTWSSLPKKGQLAVLTLARLSEPLSERSLAAYMFYQLRWFNPDASEATIASQGGILTAAFAAAQFLVAVWWGRAADNPKIGRKRVILIGLFGTFVASVGIGVSRSFGFALFCRIMAGFLNGNSGVMRTMISELIREKKYQSRAFLLMPMCFNIGVIIGPIMGGFLADPFNSFPNVFGPGSSIGGKDGVQWMKDLPYLLPNLVSGTIMLCSAFGVIFLLDETHEARINIPDYGRQFAKRIGKLFSRSRSYGYAPVADHSAVDSVDLEEHPHSTLTPTPATAEPAAVTKPEPSPSTMKQFPLRAIFTKNVTLTILAQQVLAFHVSTFNALIFLLLPAARSRNTNAHLPFQFTGGLGLTTEQVGLATAIIGIIGLPLQILLYPLLEARLGTIRAYKTFLPFSIAAYTLLPFLVLLPDNPFIVWPSLALIFALQVLSRTFALPSGVILINNCSPSRRALGTVHGIAQSASSAARTVGPVVGGWLLGWGLQNNCVGMVWWIMAGVAVGNWGMLWIIWQGDGEGGRLVR